MVIHTHILCIQTENSPCKKKTRQICALKYCVVYKYIYIYIYT